MSEVKLKKSSGSKRKASTTSAPEEVEQSVVVDATINDSEEPKMAAVMKKKKAKKASIDTEVDAVVVDATITDSEEPKMAAAMKKKKTKKSSIDTEVEAAQVLAVEPAVRGSTILSDQKFSELPIGDKTKSALKAMGFEYMTQIQAKSIPECLGGADLVGAAKTGSGKTLAFVIPIIELLMKVEFTRKQGTGAIIISPTRELSLQIYGVLRDLMEHAAHIQTHGLVMGGEISALIRLYTGTIKMSMTPSPLYLVNKSHSIFLNPHVSES